MLEQMTVKMIAQPAYILVTTVNHLPSHESPLGATLKPGSQAMQEKEPSMLVQMPMGHTPGVWHSLMSERQKKTKKRLAIGYHLKQRVHFLGVHCLIC